MYQQTTANSLPALIDVIRSFAETAGWTVRRNVLNGATRTVTLQKSGDNIHLWNDSADGYLRIVGSVGYDGLETPYNQPNVSPDYIQNDVGSGPYPTVYLFADDSPAEAVFCVVEISAGLYRHICFGELEKLGAYTGGTFFDGTRNDTSKPDNPWGQLNRYPFLSYHIQSNVGWFGCVRCDVDGQTNYFAPFMRPLRHPTPVASGIMDHRTRDAFYERSISSWSGVTPLQPIKIRIERSSSFWSDIGLVPNCRFVNMARLAPGDEFSIGPDTWKVFPVWRQGFVDNQEYSEDVAFAYRKTV